MKPTLLLTRLLPVSLLAAICVAAPAARAQQGGADRVGVVNPSRVLACHASRWPKKPGF